jgi:hypothetical protein
MQGLRANFCAVAMLAAVGFSTEMLKDIDNQPKFRPPFFGPGVPAGRLPMKGTKNAIRRENQTHAWQSRD